MTNFGHTGHGINIANYRLLSNGQGAQGKKSPHYRSTNDWKHETRNHVGLGGTTNLASASLRHASDSLQAAAADQEYADLNDVETALRNKIAQTESLKHGLESAVYDLGVEFDACTALRGSLEERMNTVQGKLDLNRSRLQNRDRRPNRERTMDDVEKQLLNQQQLISSFVEKVNRAISHLDKEMGNIDACRARLMADLKDKANAVEVDTGVLSIGQEGGSEELALRKKQNNVLKTPQTWTRSSTDNINSARHQIADSTRLRKAIRHIIYNSRQAEHETARMLNTSMMVKLGSTTYLKEDLDRQLAEVREEQHKAEHQRRKLAAALEAKRGPLMQSKERYEMRKARPDRESVQDDVERALAREIAHLHAVTAQINQKANAIDKELENLEVAAATIEDNIRDKESALALDRKMVLLDGRPGVNTPPPSSIASYPSTQLSAAKTQTLRRIGDLEGELSAAKREREMLENSISQLKSTLRV
ncbi:Tektin family-domain-containing protein [Dunaliella salina]|uniref:Tektin family-domain-containing protein n=1 Tax=Dunaliella salina TaxID=3046 RepID=A0ABQ7G5H2_DUNSA|nr:Tektin family-domain-containing protein [Dunaliella salina]|eukprot:KAF5829855.1 Tektin family-domain-containing protein [Dunaliella salina]